ncbi:hypothetical protein ACFFV7_08270 [Nonomuraea spiralis]|uniref:Cytidyltransferase-like domain-containing protein n=1 Tax=Nonomuraea spiralis TaxID=46182 RepID=A0ABV5IBM5_9ACTN|nr:hypothetical protein [Nonomuraea spiralis]GGT06998.1 hypothetical protein GCM10010176_059340 [Nonomuraea spiralis]
MTGPLVVIGDTLLDVDVQGESERLCPDAPVPVVDVAAEHARPGGGGLAAVLAARDGAEVVLITAIGAAAVRTREQRLGDALVVCVNSDDSVRRLKGSSRPVVDARDRVEVLRALSCVDAVLVFEEDTPAESIELLRPDVWVTGGDYEGEVLPESRALERLGAEFVALSTLPGRSTSNLIREIQ